MTALSASARAFQNMPHSYINRALLTLKCSPLYLEAEGKSFDIHEKCLPDCSKCQPDSNENSQEIEEFAKNNAQYDGKFTVITSACTRCASRFTPKGLSPGAHLGDGLLDLIFVCKTSRLNYFR